MKKQIECFYQEKFVKIQGFDSEFLPASLHNIKNVKRLKIHAHSGNYEHLLKELEFPDHTWIVFVSGNDLSGDKVKECKLSWLQKIKVKGLCDDKTLFLMTGRLHEMLVKAEESTLWNYGAGIALSVTDLNDTTFKKAIDIQVNLGSKFVNAIDREYRCTVIANADGYGVDIIWSTDYTHAAKIKEWAKQLINIYKWKGYPFLNQ